MRDVATRQPFHKELRIAERIATEAQRRGLLVYPGTGCVDGVNGDHVLVGPPFTISDDEMEELVGVLDETVRAVASEVST